MNALLDKFEEWLKGTGKEEKTAREYRNAIDEETIPGRALYDLKLNFSLPSNEETQKDLFARQEFKDFNTHQSNSSRPMAAIKKYVEFLQQQSAVSSSKPSFNWNLEEFALILSDDQNEKRLTSRYIKSLIAKPFVILTGNSGTGKSRMAIMFADWLVGKEGYAFVPVGADWTDNRNVLGYVNMLKAPVGNPDSSVYEATAILELIWKATQAKEQPFFLILDEMNLSHVERYFSDFLAHIESPEQPLLIHSQGSGKVFFSFNHAIEVPEKIEFPKNLFVVGTVNVDETTYMFSPKVLDRANVIEFRTSHDALKNAQGKPSSSIALSDATSDRAAYFLELALQVRERTSSLQLELSDSVLDDYKKAILDVFDILQKWGLEFGFRVQKEMLAYARVDHHFHSSSSENQTSAWDWQKCFDEQMMQKILPKMGGNEKKIGKVLVDLSNFCTGKLEASSFAGFDKGDPIPEPFEKNLSYTKLLQMRRRLAEERTTRYL